MADVKRYEPNKLSPDLDECEWGDYVLYSAARAREDALLEALKELSESCWSNKRAGGVEIHAPAFDILTKAIEIAQEIEGSR